MSHFKLNSLILIAAVALASISCKKKDEDTTILYLNGSLRFDVPAYLNPGDEITMVPSGLTHPEGKEIGYYWKVTPSMSSYDTTRFLNGLDNSNDAVGKPSNGSFTYKFSDTLQTYNVYAYGYAEDYTNSSTSMTTVVVSPGPNGSITRAGIDVIKDPSILVDELYTFYYTTIGELDWFKQNLSNVGSGAPFMNCEAMDGVFGLYYSYEEAMKACPEGWRLPTDKEWLEMIETIDNENKDLKEFEIVDGVAAKLMANARFNGLKMWEYWPEVGEITNDSGLGFIPAGYANLGSKNSDGKYPTAKFTGAHEYAVFWTADLADANTAYYRYVYCDQSDFQIGKGDRNSFGASVRCVREHVKQ